MVILMIDEKVLSMIDDRILYRRIAKEWREQSNGLLKLLELELCEKYNLKTISRDGMGGIWECERKTPYYRPDLQELEW